MAFKDKLSDKKLASLIIESAQEIWLAGLSAFEKAEQEGNQFFDNLVEEGRKIEGRVRQSADTTLEEVKRSAAGNLDSLERVFEDRVARALKQLGIPSQDDILALNRQVDEIDRQIQALKRASGEADSHDPEIDDASRDNLKRINGIGEAIEKKLNAHGVTTFKQIAGWSDSDIEQIETTVLTGRFAGRIRREDWVAQARAQHLEKYQEAL